MRLPFDLYLKGHHLLLTPLVGVRYTQYDEVDPYAPSGGRFRYRPDFR